MKPRKPARSFDELIASYYGAGADCLPSLELADEVIANYYGRSVTRPRTAPTVFVSLDTGEVLPQRRVVEDRDDYVAARGNVIDIDPDEYIVAAPALARPASLAASAEAAAEVVPPFDEYLVDLREPLREAGRETPRAPSPPAAQRPAPQDQAAQPRTAPAPAPATTPPSPATPAPEATSQPQATEDDFMADMKSILTGRKVFDPASGKTVERDRLARPSSVEDQKSDAPPPPSNAHAIFDRIARNLSFANAYDGGTIELSNRFADFDQIEEAQRRAEQQKRPGNANGSGNGKRAGEPAAATAEFVEDLAAIRTQSATTPYSQPFYDTGEHVLLGGDLYPERLRLGKSPGVLFSYGQVIALADLYKDVDQALEADPGELRRIKELIEKSTAYHRGQKRDKSLDVDDEMWDAATRDRYLDLAEENYEHFSPNQLFKNARPKLEHGNHKAAWEEYHQRAIEEAQRLFLSATNKTVFPERPLIINAFGDHFLTDAFAAGHLINKEELIALFKQNFVSGGSLKPEAERFFADLAELAFKGDVKRKFSVLETYKPVFLWWNPNIDTVNAFRKLLVKAMNEHPEQVANLAVKALHDDLNEHGIEVYNDAGDKNVKLFGDNYLDPKYTAIVKRAVAQSAANIEDPVIRASNLNFQAMFARVWRYVPQLTDASRARVIQLAGDYTRPDSALLKTAAAKLITNKVNSFIKKLISMKKLKPDV